MTTFVPNPKGMAELEGMVRVSPGLREMVDHAAEAAKAAAPVRTGAYREGIEVVETPEGLVLAATDWKSEWIEFGTVHEAPHAPLRRGISAAGMSLREAPKP